ncbi:MAG TPA: hypothetical protein VNS60_00105 [Solirubrobacterales bacterium]|nr:hypothetical protein [Solirubrobacterales bacterium]
MYRSNSQLAVGIVIAVVAGAWAIGSLAGGDQTSLAIAGVLFGLMFVILGLRLAWAAIFSSSDGIRVANIFSSFDLSWHDIERFEIGRWKLLPYVCLIHLKDGKTTHAFGIEESTQRPNGSAEQMANELNRELIRRLSDRSETPSLSSSPGEAQSELFRDGNGH